MSTDGNAHLTGVVRSFSDNDLMVTKTDIDGLLTYANKQFLDISGYTEEELLGKPHNAVRHPHMPRALFKLMWDRLNANEEIFAFVCNRCKNGDHYWAFSHVTPTFSPSGAPIGFHCSRRTMSDDALKTIEPLYETLHSIEQEEKDEQDAQERSLSQLHDEIQRLGYASYDRFVLTLGR